MDGHPNPCDTGDCNAYDTRGIPEGMERCFPFFLDISPYPADRDDDSEGSCRHSFQDTDLQSSSWTKMLEEKHVLATHEDQVLNLHITSEETGFLDLMLRITRTDLFDPRPAPEIYEHVSRYSFMQVSRLSSKRSVENVVELP
jgi:hypothetical protein